MKPFLRTIVLAVVLICATAISAQATSMTRDRAIARFVEANELYKRGDYAQAAQVFEAVVAGGWESGEVYYNLGNSYYKLNQVGESMLSYERGLRLMPRDPDLLANWRLARSGVQNRAVLPRGFLKRLVDRQVRSYSRDEFAFGFIILLTLLLGVHLLSLFLRWPITKSRIVILGVLVLWVVVSALFALKVFAEKDMAVVLSSVESRFEPREQATTHYRLSEGEKVRIVKRDGLWRKVRRSDGKDGWVEREKVEKIAAEGRF